MEFYRVRIKYHNGDIEIVDLSFSQLCEILQPLRSEEQRLKKREFWKGTPIDVADRSIKLLLRR